jgi:hypothetical protein
MLHRQDRTAAHTVIAAVLVIGVTVGACGTPPPPTTVPATPSPSPSPTAALLSASPAAISPAPTPTPASQPVGVGLDASPSPAFAGDPVTPHGQRLRSRQHEPPHRDRDGGLRRRLDRDRVRIVRRSCPDGPHVPARRGLPAHGDRPHRLRREPGRAGSPAANIASSTTTLHVFPSAPAASASWPACSTFQLHLAGAWTGAGLGNVATQITLTNVSARACTLKGYPGVLLVGADGRPLVTHATPATTGAYLFPAVVPHRVALAPGDVATFKLGYGDNPSGAGLTEPYAVACPVTSAVKVTLPGTREFGTAIVSIAPCEGLVQLSPIVPGANRLTF